MKAGPQPFAPDARSNADAASSNDTPAPSRSPAVRSRRASARAARPSRRAVADRTSEIALHASRTPSAIRTPIHHRRPRWRDVGGLASVGDGSLMAVGGRTSRPGPRIPGRRERTTGPRRALGSLSGHEGRLPGRTGRLQRARGALPVPRCGAVALRCGPPRLLPRHERRGGLRRRPARELAGRLGQRDLRPALDDDLAPDRGGGGRPGRPRAPRRSRRAARRGPPRPVALAGARPVRGVPRLDADRADAGARHGGRRAARRRSSPTPTRRRWRASTRPRATGWRSSPSGSRRTRRTSRSSRCIGTVPADLGPHDKTSLVMAVLDEPGSLLHSLEPFATRGINMHKLESRPRRGRPFEYVMYVDVMAADDDPALVDALAEIERHTSLLRVLGLVPVGRRARLRWPPGATSPGPATASPAGSSGLDRGRHPRGDRDARDRRGRHAAGATAHAAARPRPRRAADQRDARV